MSASARGSRGAARRRPRRVANGAEARDGLYRAISGLQRLTEVMERRRLQLARHAGLSPQQWRVLEEISGDEFMPSLFARARECSPAGVSRTLRELLGRRLVAVAVSREDARRREYSLTRSGRRVLDKVRSAREAAVEAVWADLDRSELERFADLAIDLAERLESYAARVVR